MVRHAIYATLIAALMLPACGGDSSPTSPGGPTAPPPTAPTTESPTQGAALAATQPVLAVLNATGGSGPRTYTFEVAPDRNFGSIEASVEGVAEGNGGTTSWQVTPPLDTGMQHWWRVRATAAGSSGPYSEAINFSIKEGFASDRYTGGVVVWDPLTNGSSVAFEVVGGRFIEQGWRVQARNHYIRYQVPTLRDGYVEFDVTNIREPNPSPGSRMLLSMWDPTRGEYTTNPFRMHLQKLDRNSAPHMWDIRLRWISRGDQTDTGISFYDFDADVVYPWRIEWGEYRDAPNKQVKVFLEGMEILTRNYSKTYAPTVHWIELGNQARAEGLEEAIFSNVKIGER